MAGWWGNVGDRAGDLHTIEGRDGVDVGGCEDGLAANAVVTVVGVGGAGHIAAGAGAGAGTVAVVARRASYPFFLFLEGPDLDVQQLYNS